MESSTKIARLAAAGSATGSRSLREAALAAASDLGSRPSLRIVFPSQADPEELADIGAIADSCGCPIVGMSGNGSISADGPVEAGCTALALSDAVTAGVGLVSEPEESGVAGGAEPVQIAGTSAVERSVVAVALSSPEPLAVGVAHGCRMVGTPSPPLAGLFTHGEVARVRGAKGDRNHAIVVLAFG